MFNEDAFVKDVSRLASISDDQRGIVSSLLNREVFANSDTVVSALSEANVEDPKRIAGVLQKLSAMFRESNLEKDEAFDAFSNALSSSKVDESKRQSLQDAFRDLCLVPTALDLQQKAESLASATGCTVGALDIVCDIRPIFNVEGDKIVGAIPYFTLRVEYDDGESQKIDLHLSNENIDRLKDVVDRAICKREVMEATVASMPEWSSPRLK